MLRKKVPLYLTLLLIVSTCAITVFGISWINRKNTETVTTDNSFRSCSLNRIRLSGYEFIRPLLFTEEPCESDKLMPAKSELDNIINTHKMNGSINSASVYIRDLNHGEWTIAGDQEKYFPGSLMKVPELITFMKMNEKNPGLLDRKILYKTAFNLPKQAIYLSKSIEVGKTYTIRELLYYMIAYSDNYATMILNQQMDPAIFSKVFTDLGIPKPDLTQKDITISARDYSLFLRVLYNASYLNIEDSEFCTELLSHCDFTKGIINELPKELKVAHKFGEAGDGTYAHFCESGIIYLNNSPYLITSMVKGKDSKLLPSVNSEISKKLFDLMSQM